MFRPSNANLSSSLGVMLGLTRSYKSNHLVSDHFRWLSHPCTRIFGDDDDTSHPSGDESNYFLIKVIMHHFVFKTLMMQVMMMQMMMM